MKPSGKVLAKKAGGSKRSTSVPMSSKGYESVSVRPIDNGYLICCSTDKGYSEVYSATKPKLEVPKPTKK